MEQIVPQIERELRAKYAHALIRWYEAVDWREPLLVGALSFHAALLAAVVLARRRLAAQGALFALIVALLAATEPLNGWAHDHWRLVASQQYFDRRGVFMGIFYAGPLLFTGFVQLVREIGMGDVGGETERANAVFQAINLKTMADMVVTVKRAELRQQQRREGKKQQ